MDKKKSQKTPLRSLLVLTGIAFQMGTIIYLFIFLGKWLDTTYNNSNKIYIIITTLFGVAISLYVVLRQVKRLHQ